MDPQTVRKELLDIESSTTPPDKSPRYERLLHSILEDSRPDTLSKNLSLILDYLLDYTLGIVASRPLLARFVGALSSVSYSDVKIEVGQHAIDLLQPRIVAFEEEDAKIREMMAATYEAQEDWLSAAKVLKDIQLETSQRKILDDDKIKIWIRIIRNFLEEDDTVSADIYLNRVKTLIYKCQNQELLLMFKLCSARILDARRKFLDACQAYLDMSFSPIVVEEERMRALSSAIVCAVLAPAGPQRSRTLAKLYKDERSVQVDEFSILEKIFLDRLLSPAEVENFSKRLSEHHLAKTADGSTVLAKAVIEHNLLGASRIYDNIGTNDLGVLLGLTGEEAEGYAARMIEQGRLSGRIDQIDQVIFFDGGDGSGERTTAGQADLVVGKELRRWDSNIQGLAEDVERVTTLLQDHYPVRRQPLDIEVFG